MSLSTGDTGVESADGAAPLGERPTATSQVTGAPRSPILAADADPRRLVAQVVDGLRAGRAVAVLDARWPHALRAAASRLVHEATVAPRDLVVFTSGSSGWPRAVHRTSASWLASADALTRLLEPGADDLVWFPGHPTATAVLYAAWHAHLIDLPVRYAGESRADATIVHAPPSLVPGLLRDRVEGRLSRLRLIVAAGDRVGPQLGARCRAVGVRLIAYYGAAELSFVALADDDRPGYRPFPGVELDVRDGLLWSRSAYRAIGYLGQATGPLRVDADGWACVGDRARLLESGRVEVLGRADQAVTVSGHTVLVEDVEAALRAVPGVDDAVVVGLADPVHGQRLAGLWTGASSADVASVRGELPAPARPRVLRHVTQLPRLAGGKSDRAAARRLLADGRRGGVATDPDALR